MVRFPLDVHMLKCTYSRWIKASAKLYILSLSRYPSLPASDRGCGRGTQPLCQLQLVWEEGGTAGTAEPAEESKNTQVSPGQGGGWTFYKGIYKDKVRVCVYNVEFGEGIVCVNSVVPAVFVHKSWSFPFWKCPTFEEASRSRVLRWVSFYSFP